MALQEQEQRLWNEAMVSLAADDEAVRKIAFSLEAFEAGVVDPTNESDRDAASDVMTRVYELTFSGKCAAIQLAFQRRQQERQEGTSQ